MQSSKEVYVAPANFKALLACQKDARRRFIRQYKEQQGHAVPASILTQIRNEQWSEALGFLKNKPKPEANIMSPSKDEKEALENSESAKTNSAARANSGDIQGLKALLESQADGGKQGITPQMTDSIRDFLRTNQGGMSPDMESLLNAVQKDGVNLSSDTMNKLRRAAKDAKQSGVNLNVKPDMEQDLMSPPDQETPNASPNIN